MKVETKEIQPQVQSVSITIEKADYEEKLLSELKKLKKTATLKGFRVGKTPMSVIKKYYGESTMAKVVSSSVEEELGKALKENNINNILQPTLSNDSKAHSFDPNKLEDYEFLFEVPVFNEFDVEGLGEENSILNYKIEVEDKIVEDELTMVRKRLGSEITVEKDINEEDRITIHCKELNTKGNVKRGGWDTGFSVLINLLDDEYKEQLLGKDVGFEFDFDIYKIEKDKSDKYVKKYLLNLDDEEEKKIGNQFRGEVKEISRIDLAEVNQEFLDKYMGEGVVSSEEEAKEKIKENIGSYYKTQTDAFLRRSILDYLMEKNPMTLPDEYLKNYLKENNPELTDEVLEKEYDSFAQNIKWDAVKGKLFNKYKVNVDFEEVQDRMRVKVRNYLGNQMMGIDLEPLVQNLMKDSKELSKTYEEVASEKVLDQAAQDLTLQEESVSLEKFGELVKEMNERING